MAIACISKVYESSQSKKLIDIVLGKFIIVIVSDNVGYILLVIITVFIHVNYYKPYNFMKAE